MVAYDASKTYAVHVTYFTARRTPPIPDQPKSHEHCPFSVFEAPEPPDVPSEDPLDDDQFSSGRLDFIYIDGRVKCPKYGSIAKPWIEVKMFRTGLLPLCLVVVAVRCSDVVFPPFTGNPFERYSISADGINATFMPYGARLTNLFVEDKDGIPRDVVMGYDNGQEYLVDSEMIHSYMGAVVGRYANRISFGTFEIDGTTYHVPENKGNSTLHGGWVGYDQRNWTVVSHSNDSITFLLYDAGYEGFPGDLVNFATYTVSPGPRWTSRLVSIPLNKATPVMLSNHVYWNVGAFVNSKAQTVLDNTLYLPYSHRYVQVAIDQVPNGTIGTVDGTYLDFTTPTLIGSQINEANHCGINCTGYNNAYIIDRPADSGPESTDLTVLSMSSPDTGIQLDVKTNMQSLEIFSCNWFNGTIRGKADQQYGSNSTFYELHGCIVIEPQGWIDAINNPQFGQDQYQIFSPTTEPAVNFATYDFSIIG